MRHRKLFDRPRAILTSACIATLSIVGLPEAQAGCLSNEGCDMAKSATAVLTPDPGCIVFDVDGNECTCRSTLVVTNGCEVPLEAIGFEWCKFNGDTYCTPEVDVGGGGNLFLPRDGADAAGEHEVDLPVRLGDQELTLTLTYDVQEVTSGLGCSVGGPDVGSGAPLAGGLVVALLALALARPRLRVTKPRRARLAC